jgi:hypothetical protein
MSCMHPTPPAIVPTDEEVSRLRAQLAAMKRERDAFEELLLREYARRDRPPQEHAA